MAISNPRDQPRGFGPGTAGKTLDEIESESGEERWPREDNSDTDASLSPEGNPPAYDFHQTQQQISGDFSDLRGRMTTTSSPQTNTSLFNAQTEQNPRARGKFPRIPRLFVLATVIMASFTGVAYILLFLFPSLYTLGHGSSVISPTPTPAPSLSTSLPIATGERERSSLGDFALQKVLGDASGVFGLPTDEGNTSSLGSKDRGEKRKKSNHRSNWMSLISDSTPITEINIPGTHDSATWNFTQETADSIRHNIDPANGVLPAEVYRCQRVSLWGALEAGVRFFDLRYGLDPEGVRLVFYHAHALMSELATVDDVLFGFYNWLDSHPSETIVLSFKIEDTGINIKPDDHLKTQFLLFQALTSPAAKEYILQRHDSLGTLGPARGKIILFRRFDNPFDPSSGQGKETVLPGIHLSPSVWTENSKGFLLTYNAQRNLSAHIEDYYEPRDLSPDKNATVNIRVKVDAVRNSLQLAASSLTLKNDKSAKEEETEGKLFITFTSAEHSANQPPITPIIMALGNGTTSTPAGGANRQLVKEILPTLRGKKVGIVIIDFWDGLDLYGEGYANGEEDVVGAILDL